VKTLTRGLLAGAAGATALNTATYLDMAVRARPASTVPEQSVQKLATAAHVDLGGGHACANRKTALGALIGYATAAAVGTAYAGAAARRLSPRASAAVLTVLAMVAANGPITLLKITDPRRWTAEDWLADLVPHVAYGVTTAVALEHLR
jgi:hypothetical protein